MIAQNKFRRLCVLQGYPDAAFYHKLAQLQEIIPGDWLVISDSTELANAYPAAKAKQLLGQEFKHAIFDATVGFNLDAFAMLAGTLMAGSILILLLPDQGDSLVDGDSLRWNESPQAIATPNFISHLNNTLNHHGQIIYCQSMVDFQPQQFIEDNHCWLQTAIMQKVKSNKLTPSVEQQIILQKLLMTQKKTAILIAKRGRGKSALAGFFSQYKQCWLTAPNKSATMTLQTFAKTGTPFFAPDALLSKFAESVERPEWLIIDEAAAIPIPVLEKLLEQATNVLLTTTIDGYEGTGQGILLKLAPIIGDYEQYRLDSPIRWGNHDPLEHFVDELLLNADHEKIGTVQLDAKDSVTYQLVKQHQLMEKPSIFKAIYQLLKQAHYRTTPVDLRRILDAQNIVMATASFDNKIMGVILSIQEGGLTAELSQAIWQGIRRPKGNLVAQSLVAHAGVCEAAQLYSLRINRIVVQEGYRRQGIARQLIQQHIEFAKRQQCDFVSVSFAYSDEIERFWRACGFKVVHVGSHKEASSGCYAAMAIYPLSEAGMILQQRLADKLSRNWYWWQRIIDISLPISVNTLQIMDNHDWQELKGFAHYYRPLESSYPALGRLLSEQSIAQQYDMNVITTLIDVWHSKQSNRQQLIEFYQIKGKNELIQRIRNEVKRILLEVRVNE